ncbi:MAG: hypothetical protein ACREDY_28515, partial [Bradyrhizobium sp.]
MRQHELDLGYDFGRAIELGLQVSFRDIRVRRPGLRDKTRTGAKAKHGRGRSIAALDPHRLTHETA